MSVMYAVIEIDLCYDCIDGVICRTVCSDKDNAERYIKELQAEHQKSWELRLKYIDDYVNKMFIPVMTHKELMEYISKFRVGYCHSISGFIQNLKISLRADTSYMGPSEYMKDYNPPKHIFLGQLFVVEIQNAIPL